MPQNKIKLPDVNTSTGTGAFVFATAPTIQTSLNGAYLTASELLITDGSKNIISAPVATYPSLTELSYVKGLTSGAQAQINGKQATIAGTLTDTYVATVVAGVATWAAASGGGTPAGATTQIQYNNAGAFGASPSLVWDETNYSLGINTTPSSSEHLVVKGVGLLPGYITSYRNAASGGFGTGYYCALNNLAGSKVFYSYFNGYIVSNTTGSHSGGLEFMLQLVEHWLLK